MKKIVGFFQKSELLSLYVDISPIVAAILVIIFYYGAFEIPAKYFGLRLFKTVS